MSLNPEDKLELIVILYMNQDPLRWQDVDNRLKDIMDALQGRAGGRRGQSGQTRPLDGQEPGGAVGVEENGI